MQCIECTSRDHEFAEFVFLSQILAASWAEVRSDESVESACGPLQRANHNDGLGSVGFHLSQAMICDMCLFM